MRFRRIRNSLCETMRKGSEINGRRNLFIINPCSGKEQIRNKLIDILDIFTKAGFQIQTYITQSQGDARKAAERFGNEASIVVCSGGDGTLNETISGVMHLEQPPLLGYVPAGSTNDFASSLMLPKNMLDAAKGVTEGAPYAIDIGQFGEEGILSILRPLERLRRFPTRLPRTRKTCWVIRLICWKESKVWLR